jgi:tRNA pseudouridine13 synthase
VAFAGDHEEAARGVGGGQGAGDRIGHGFVPEELRLVEAIEGGGGGVVGAEGRFELGAVRRRAGDHLGERGALVGGQGVDAQVCEFIGDFAGGVERQGAQLVGAAEGEEGAVERKGEAPGVLPIDRGEEGGLVGAAGEVVVEGGLEAGGEHLEREGERGVEAVEPLEELELEGVVVRVVVAFAGVDHARGEERAVELGGGDLGAAVGAVHLVRQARQATDEDRPRCAAGDGERDHGETAHALIVYCDAVKYLTENLPGTGGLLKSEPEDFVVEEIPAYAPSGEGTHLFLQVEKRGITTQEMVRRIARELGVDPDDIGTAGQKDRQAVARQVVSVPATDIARASNLKLEGVEVLSAARHQNKLRTGHLRGNRFTITLRGVGEEAEARARAILDALVVSWLPNRFGVQRFGVQGDNAEVGRGIVLGGRHEEDRFRRRFLISAYQSKLFNRYLDLRMEEALLHRVMVGDVMQKTDTGGLFYVAREELAWSQARLEMRHVVPTGPMFGHKMFTPPEGSAAWTFEKRVLDEEGLDPAVFGQFGKLAEGTRRALLARLEGTSARQNGDALTIAFALPSGAYATVLLEEIMKPGAPLRHPGDT